MKKRRGKLRDFLEFYFSFSKKELRVLFILFLFCLLVFSGLLYVFFNK